MIIAKEIEEVHGSGEADDHSLRDKSPAPLCGVRSTWCSRRQIAKALE